MLIKALDQLAYSINMAQICEEDRPVVMLKFPNMEAKYRYMSQILRELQPQQYMMMKHGDFMQFSDKFTIYGLKVEIVA